MVPGLRPRTPWEGLDPQLFAFATSLCSSTQWHYWGGNPTSEYPGGGIEIFTFRQGGSRHWMTLWVVVIVEEDRYPPIDKKSKNPHTSSSTDNEVYARCTVQWRWYWMAHLAQCFVWTPLQSRKIGLEMFHSRISDQSLVIKVIWNDFNEFHKLFLSTTKM